MTAKTSTERVNKMRQEAKAKGWKRRDYYATPEEHTKIWLFLQDERREK